MHNANMARILQNMIDEAEENLTYLEKVHEGREHLGARFSDLTEAVALVEELNALQAEASGAGRYFAPSRAGSDGIEQIGPALSIKAEASKEQARAALAHEAPNGNN